MGIGGWRLPTLSDEAIVRLGEIAGARLFSCGHPQVAENEYRLPRTIGVRCEICRRRAARQAQAAPAPGEQA